LGGERARYALHKYLGILSVLLGLYNIRSGLQMWNPDNAISATYSTGLMAIGAMATSWNVAALM
jgi:predicted ferric reductase